MCDRPEAAHLIARLRTHEAANSAIKEGLVIAGKRVWARRIEEENPGDVSTASC